MTTERTDAGDHRQSGFINGDGPGGDSGVRTNYAPATFAYGLGSGVIAKTVRTRKGGKKLLLTGLVRCPECYEAGKTRRRGCHCCGGRGTVKMAVRMPEPGFSKREIAAEAKTLTEEFLAKGGKIQQFW